MKRGATGFLSKKPAQLPAFHFMEFWIVCVPRTMWVLSFALATALALAGFHSVGTRQLRRTVNLQKQL
jgi:hypothetical protein